MPHPLDIAVVVPTYNERANIAELIARLDAVLAGLAWELIFVDDDSPDGTAALVLDFARRDPRIRLLHRIGRRGLASACIEGILATSAAAVAVLDADMQHDETILPCMLQTLQTDRLDLVIGTRNACGGSMGQFGTPRILLSRLGQRISRFVCRCHISDPMSGYFLVSRAFFSEVAHGLRGVGFKILVDMLATADRPVRFAEIGYTFRLRRHGVSKFDGNTALEYFLLILHKLLRRPTPPRTDPLPHPTLVRTPQ